MNKFLLIPDSFKGTMSSIEICNIIGDCIRKYYPESEIINIPVADGGEGSVDAFLEALGGEKVFVNVKGPYGEKVKGFYGILEGNVAVIEMAAAAGLPLVSEMLNPSKTSTYGVGQLMLDAVSKGCKKIILGLGGSATNDGGCGAAASCGVKFYNCENKTFVPVGGTLDQVVKIDTSQLEENFKDIEIVTMCDIDNPYYGETGAAYIFAPQKGADEQMVVSLDNNLKALAKVMEKDCGVDVQKLPGSGAAGGFGGGMVAFFKSELQMGIETVLDTVKFDQLLNDAYVVFTGEGKIDNQSLRGKVVIGVASRAKKQDVPVYAIVGDIGDDIAAVYDRGVTGIFSINRVAKPFEQVKQRSKSDLALTVDNLLRVFKRYNL